VAGVDERAVWSAEQWDDAYDEVPLDLDLTPDPVLERVLGGRPAGRGLELGCGEGRPSVWLATRGWAMTAVDFSRVALERARLLARAQEVVVDWRRVDVDARIQLDGPLDLVLVHYLHLPPAQLHPALARAAAALAPGGMLVVRGWDRANVERGTGGPRPAELLLDAAELAAVVPDLEVRAAEHVWQGEPDGASDLLWVGLRPM
jgi:SAM-dependent methyltransferase